jgi:hypothetical protein
MIKRFTTITAILATAAALTVGGVAVAQSGSKPHHKKATHHATRHAVRHAAETTGPDTDNVQSGDTTTPDTGSAAATSETSSSETASESAPSDGPGGHEDEPGAEVDHQE